jgi:hypothetical protein
MELSIGAKNKGRQREEIAGIIALGFVVVRINRQVVLVRSIILLNACWASLVIVWASSKTISLKSASSGQSAAYDLIMYLKLVSRLSCIL